MVLFLASSLPGPVRLRVELCKSWKLGSFLFQKHLLFNLFTIQTSNSFIIIFLSRYTLWMTQSWICPPFFYVVIAEKDNLKFLCPQLQNAVVPIMALQEQVHTVNCWINIRNVLLLIRLLSNHLSTLGWYEKHCQRHNGPEGWVLLTKLTSLGHITSSNTNLDQTSSKSQPNISISTKLKLNNLDQT